MDKKVAGHSLAVLLEAAPAEEARRVEGPFRRIPQEGLPVNGLWAGVGRNRVNPGAGGRIASEWPSIRCNSPIALMRKSPQPSCTRYCSPAGYLPQDALAGRDRFTMASPSTTL